MKIVENIKLEYLESTRKQKKFAMNRIHEIQGFIEKRT